MTSPEKRLQEIISGLSPEEKARLAIEDGLRKEPVLSPSDCHRMVQALTPQEGPRYNRVIDRYQSLLANLRLLTQLVDEARRQLLLRDRILWFERALIELDEAIVFDAAVADALLVKNPNLEAGKPLVLRLSLGNLGIVYKNRDDLDAAEEHLKRALAIQEEIDDRLGQAATLGNLGTVYRGLGEMERAEEHYQKALSLFQQVGAQPQIAQTQRLIDELVATSQE